MPGRHQRITILRYSSAQKMSSIIFFLWQSPMAGTSDYDHFVNMIILSAVASTMPSGSTCWSSDTTVLQWHSPTILYIFSAIRLYCSYRIENEIQFMMGMIMVVKEKRVRPCSMPEQVGAFFILVALCLIFRSLIIIL